MSTSDADTLTGLATTSIRRGHTSIPFGARYIAPTVAASAERVCPADEDALMTAEEPGT